MADATQDATHSERVGIAEHPRRNPLSSPGRYPPSVRGSPRTPDHNRKTFEDWTPFIVFRVSTIRLALFSTSW
jgi:hypothetical protein